jgi:menaquinone-9 beta-reductase
MSARQPAVAKPADSPAPVPATLSLSAAAATRWQAIVVGAGPAGFATARRLAHRGLRVLLIDAATMPRPKLCGCCLSATAVRELALLARRDGRLEPALPPGAVPLERVRLATAAVTAEVPLSGGAVISREALDSGGVRGAIAAGAAWLPQTHVSGIHEWAERAEPPAGGGLSGGREPLVVSVRGNDGKTTATLESDLVVIAVGLATAIRLEPDRAGPFRDRPTIAAASRLGVGTTLPAGVGSLPAGELVMAVAPHGYCGLVRLEDGRLDLAAAVDRKCLADAGSPAAAIAGILAASRGDRAAGLVAPAVSDLLAAATFRGTPPLTRTSPVASPSGRVLRVGDAAGYVEPFTGEGMGWALTSARLLDEAFASEGTASGLVSGGLTGAAARYAALHHRHFGRHHARCRRVALAVRRPWLVGSVVRLAHLAPAMAARIAPFVVGTAAPWEARG